jgi:hypothetical protein
VCCTGSIFFSLAASSSFAFMARERQAMSQVPFSSDLTPLPLPDSLTVTLTPWLRAM